MQINNDSNNPLQVLLSARPAHAAMQKVREEHLQNLGEQFLNKLEPAQAREILFRQIAKRLSHLGSPQPTLPQNNEPAALVDIGVRLQQQGTRAETIRAQMQQGLSEGRQWLDSPQLPAPTRDSINQFAQQLNRDIEASPLAANYQQDRYQQSHSAAIEIRTKEGDTITIHMSAEQSGINTSLGVGRGNSAASLYESVQNNSSNLRIEIDGNLNDEELKGITGLLNKINGLAEKFFSGQDQAAFASIGSLQMNDALAGFDLKLSSQEQNSQTSAQANGPLQFIEDFVTDSGTVIQQAEHLLRSDNNGARQAVSDLLHGMLQLKHPEAPLNNPRLNDLERRLKTDLQSSV